MTRTNQARVALLLTPIALPFILILDGFGAIWPAAKEWWWAAGWSRTLLEWYRNVYRVARYGSVWDD